MIKREELEEAIAECQGERNPNANTCIKLAAYYTIKRELENGSPVSAGYSYDAPKTKPETTVFYEGDTDFARAIQGKPIEYVLFEVEELVETVRVLLPRVYAAFLRNLEKN